MSCGLVILDIPLSSGAIVVILAVIVKRVHESTVVILNVAVELVVVTVTGLRIGEIIAHLAVLIDGRITIVVRTSTRALRICRSRIVFELCTSTVRCIAGVFVRIVPFLSINLPFSVYFLVCILLVCILSLSILLVCVLLVCVANDN